MVLLLRAPDSKFSTPKPYSKYNGPAFKPFLRSLAVAPERLLKEFYSNHSGSDRLTSRRPKPEP